MLNLLDTRPTEPNEDSTKQGTTNDETATDMINEYRDRIRRAGERKAFEDKESEQQYLAKIEQEKRTNANNVREMNRVIETKIRGGVPLTAEEQMAILARQEQEAKQMKEAVEKKLKSKKQLQADISNKLSWKNQVLTNRMREVYDISYDVPEDFLNQTKRALNLWGIHVPGECQLDEHNVREWDYNVFYMPSVPQRSRFTYNPFTSSLHMRTLTDTGYPQTRDLNLEVDHAVKMCAIK